MYRKEKKIQLITRMYLSNHSRLFKGCFMRRPVMLLLNVGFVQGHNTEKISREKRPTSGVIRARHFLNIGYMLCSATTALEFILEAQIYLLYSLNHFRLSHELDPGVPRLRRKRPRPLEQLLLLSRRRRANASGYTW